MTFAPREDGDDADIQISYHDYDTTNHDTVELERQELSVSRAYLGAARIGIGGVFDVFSGQDAIPQTYSAVTTPFSDAPQLRSTGDPAAAVEIQIGASCFLYDVIRGNGRDYTRRDAWSYLLPALYGGVGLLSTSTFQSLSGLASIHLGLEWEPASGFAIAFTFAIYRGAHLASWAREGIALSGNNVPLEGDAWRPAIGLVLNLSPDFLRIPGGQ